MTGNRACGHFQRLEAEGVHTSISSPRPTISPRLLRRCSSSRPKVPVVYNTGGYELAHRIEELTGFVQIYLPDFKYMTRALPAATRRHPTIRFAKSALAEMVRQQPDETFDETA